jgi:hypothetical protein
MNRRIAIALLIPLLSITAWAQVQNTFPKLLAVARYVYVETPYGPTDETVLDPRVTNEDRQAVADLEKAIQSWGRYQLTVKPIEAELIFVVRAGRLATVNAGAHGSTGSAPAQRGQSPTTVGVEYGAEVGPPNDYLAVYVRNPDGKKLSNPLWEGSLDHGLETPAMPLFKKFREQVETALKK